jgi:hypothetical protein
LTEPRVPEVEVLGSGRAVMEVNDLQEKAAEASKIINEYIKAFITIVFILLAMKKAGHPPGHPPATPLGDTPYSDRRLLTGLASAAEID